MHDEKIEIVYDLETIKNSRADEFFEQKKFKPNGKLKDPLKIEADIVDKRNKAKQKSGLHWISAQIVCVGVKLSDEDYKTYFGKDEKVVLDNFFNDLSQLNQSIRLVGMYSENFDSPLLRGRCLALDMGVPDFLRHDYPIKDIDHIFSRSAKCDQTAPLADYAFGIGMVHNSVGGGADVQGWWDREEYEKISDHCIDDLKITQEMLDRYNKPWVYKGE
jgi:predicted PolB exonuclease-like 3'-5' exonuclease